jgi:putative methyltransferase (TIGR04325 family)
MHSDRTDHIYFEGDYASWDDASKQCASPDTGQVLEKVLPVTLKIKRSEPLNEKDVIFFGRPRFNPALISSALSAAIRSGNRLNVLDFGGSLGVSYFHSRDFLRDLAEVKWSVIELPNMVAAGKQHLQSPELRFFDTIEGCLNQNTPNIIVMSGVLQCLPEPWTTLKRLLEIGAPYVFIDRTGVIESIKDRLTIQHVPERIYRYDHPAWWLSESRLLSCFADYGYQCLNDFKTGYQWELPGAKIAFKGFIFRKSANNPAGPCRI